MQLFDKSKRAVKECRGSKILAFFLKKKNKRRNTKNHLRDELESFCTGRIKIQGKGKQISGQGSMRLV